MADVEAEWKSREARHFLSTHSLHSLLEELTGELVQYRPNRPLTYLIDRLSQAEVREEGGRAHLPPIARPKIVFVGGAPGSGKTTLCKKLEDELGVVRISPDDACKYEIGQGTELGSKIADTIARNESISDDLMVEVMRDALSRAMAMEQEDIGTPFLVDGFPNSLTQIQAFEEGVMEGRMYLSLDCPDEVCMQRLEGKGQTEREARMAVMEYRAGECGTRLPWYFSSRFKLKQIDTDTTPEEAYKALESHFV